MMIGRTELRELFMLLSIALMLVVPFYLKNVLNFPEIYIFAYLMIVFTLLFFLFRRNERKYKIITAKVLNPSIHLASSLNEMEIIFFRDIVPFLRCGGNIENLKIAKSLLESINQLRVALSIGGEEGKR